VVKLKDITRLVAYGCSFTFGAELSDHIILNKPMIELDREKRSIGIEGFDKFISSYPKLKNEISKKVCNRLSYSAKLAKLLDLQYSNRAVVGNSLQGTVFNIENDLSNGYLKDSDLILVGITSPSRWLYFLNNGDIRTPNLAYGIDWPNKKFYEEFVAIFGNPFNFMYQYFFHLKYIELLSKNLNGRVFCVWTHAVYGQYKGWNKTENDNLLYLICDQIENFDSIIAPNLSLYGLITDYESETHGFTHPKQEIHDKFAFMLFPQIVKKYE